MKMLPDKKKQDDYIDGPHDYWIHFCCGLVFGAGIGTWIGLQSFDTGWTVIMTAAIISLAVACSCGRWGDRAWRWIIRGLSWFT
jgi:hypothetical protein